MAKKKQDQDQGKETRRGHGEGSWQYLDELDKWKFRVSAKDPDGVTRRFSVTDTTKGECRELAKALKVTTREVQEKFFRNMSKRAAMLLREDMEFMRPVNINEVEESQRRIINIVRELVDAGEIVVTSINEDEFVV